MSKAVSVVVVAGELVGEVGNSAPAQREEQLTGRPGRMLILTDLGGDNGEHRRWFELQLTEQEFIGMHGLDPPGVQGVWWEVLQVGGDDGVRVGAHGRCQNMAVLGVVAHRWDERFVSLDGGEWEGVFHLSQSSVGGVRGDVESVCDHVPSDFLEDAVGPADVEAVGFGEAEDGVVECCRQDDTGV